MNLQSTAALTTGQRQATMGLALAFCVLLLLPWGRTADVPLVLGALWALLLLRQYPRVPALLLVGVLAAAYTLPALLSCIDAVAATKSWSTALGSVRFGLFAAAMVLLLGGHPRTQAALQALIAALVGLWVLDALMQALTGWSLGGFLQADRVSGVFGADDLKLGPVLAVLSPFVLLVVRARLGRVPMAIAWLLLAAAVLLAGARAGWVSFGLVSVVLLWRESRRPLRFVGMLAAAAVLALTLGFAAYRTSPAFAERVERTAAIAVGDRVSLDFALAGRLPIWDTAWAMALAHPVNGVGVRGFRHAYASYAAPGDPWLLPRNGGAALHPHQLLLELAAETGLPGVLAWLAGAWWACRAWRRAGPAARERALAPGLALLAMTFPLNTHFAFYSSFWGLLFWWLLALYAAALADEARVAP